MHSRTVRQPSPASLLIKNLLETKRLIKVLIALIILLAIGRFTQVYLGNFYNGDRAPYLQSVAENQVVIRWQTHEKTVGRITYGLHAHDLDLHAAEKKASYEHRLLLNNLQPGTRYFYQIENFEATSPKSSHWFYTAYPANSQKNLRVWILGDPGYSNPKQLAVRDSALEWVRSNPRDNRPEFDLIITTGNNAYRSGSNKEYQSAFFSIFQQQFINTPIWPAYGNHDAKRWAFFNIFEFPENGESGGIPSNSDRYYAFNNSMTHFVMLDSLDGGRTKDDKMIQWLEKDLTANTLPWTVVIMHHPPYTKSNHNSDDYEDSRSRLFHTRENILPILQKYGADLIISGHSRSYERSALIDCHYGKSESFSDHQHIIDPGQKQPNNAIRYLKPADKSSHNGSLFAVVGSSSALTNTQMDLHNALDTKLTEYGSLILDISTNKLTARFINDHGRVLDHFEIEKDSTIKSNLKKCE